MDPLSWQAKSHKGQTCFCTAIRVLRTLEKQKQKNKQEIAFKQRK